MFKTIITSAIVVALFGIVGSGFVAYANEASATITSISAPAAPSGVIYSGEKAAIYGTGLSGQLTIKIGNQEPQYIQTTGVSDTYAEFIVPIRSQTIYTIISITNSSGIASNNYSVQIEVPAAPAPTISSVSSKAAPEGVIYSGEQATIYGTGLSGALSIKLGAQEPKIVQATGVGSSVSFTVPQYSQTSYVSVSVTNSDGLTSNSYSVKVEVSTKPKPAPVITNMQSAGNPSGVVDSGKRASISGTGLNESLTIKLGNIEPRYVQTTGISDTYAEFVVPSYQQSVSVSVTVMNVEGLTSNIYSLRIEAPTAAPVTQKPVITNISSKAAPEGVIYSGEQATIYGTGLSGSLTITLGVQEPRTVQATGSGNSVSFTVPQYQQTSYVSVAATNSEGLISNSFSVKIEVPGTTEVTPIPVTPPLPAAAPVIRNIQSAANPEGVVDAGRRAAIYGSGLSGPLTIQIGVESPQIVNTTGKSDTYAEFVVPSRTQLATTVVSVKNASGATSNTHRITIQVEGWGAVETSSVEELIQKGGKYEASDLTEKAGTLTVAPGVIRTNATAIPTTQTQLVLDVGTRAVSIEPNSNFVAIRDGNLEVTADAVVITSDGLFVVDKPVKISASEVIEKLGVDPQKIQLSSDEEQSVYNIQTEKRRKLFGFIPIRMLITFVVSGEDAEVLQERRPWYSFLTTD